MENTITLQELSEKLGGNYWEKGNLKRVYLEKGFNTKKMSTKTYVWQNDKGDFLVSCKVDCPSQPWQWCKSQEDEVKESVNEHIEHIIRLMTVELKEWKEDPADNDNFLVLISENEEEAKWLTEEDFYANFGIYPPEHFGGDLLKAQNEKWAAIRKEREEKELEKNAIEKAEIEAKATNSKNVITESDFEFGIGTNVKHQRFGNGIVSEENDLKITIVFESEGTKTLLKKFSKLEKI